MLVTQHASFFNMLFKKLEEPKLNSYLSGGTKISATNNIDEGLVYLGSF